MGREALAALVSGSVSCEVYNLKSAVLGGMRWVGCRTHMGRSAN